MAGYEPPFHMTNQIIDLLMQISEQLGRITVLQPESITPHLRKENRIRTIHSSLAIEHNTLTKEQVTAIINGKRVLGNPNEIKEVQNAYQAYELMLNLDPYSVDDLLNAHRLMMQDLIKENGKFSCWEVNFHGRFTKWFCRQHKGCYNCYNESRGTQLVIHSLSRENQ